MLRNGVNYKGLYGNSRTCFGVENKGHKLNKNSLPCLLDILAVFVYHFFRHFSTIPVGFRFTEHFPPSLSCYICPKRLITSVAIVFFEINRNANNASV